MKRSLLKNVAILLLAAMIGSPTILLARDNNDAKKDAKKTSQPAAAKDDAKNKKLSDKENPELIGKRNINKGILPNFRSLESEVALGRQIAANVDRQAKFVDDPMVNEYINRVGQNIVLHSDAKVPFTIKVLDSDDVNAFALPGGFFYVNRGLILAADNEAEIAGVMAHEIAHVAARHGTEQESKAQLANFAMIPLIFMTGGLAAIAYNAAQIGVPLAFLRFSRGAENEADMLGAQYMWATGYDPAYFVTFFEKLQKKEKDKPGTLSKLFRTHPPTPDRIDNVKELVAKFPDRDEYIVNTSDFVKVKNRLLALSSSRVIDPASGKPAAGESRPTLKRRKEGADPNQPDAKEEPQQKDRPTLKRRDSDPKPPSGNGN